MAKLTLELTAKGSKKKLLKSLNEVVEWVEKEINDETKLHYYSSGTKFNLAVRQKQK